MAGYLSAEPPSSDLASCKARLAKMVRLGVCGVAVRCNAYLPVCCRRRSSRVAE